MAPVRRRWGRSFAPHPRAGNNQAACLPLWAVCEEVGEFEPPFRLCDYVPRFPDTLNTQGAICPTHSGCQRRTRLLGLAGPQSAAGTWGWRWVAVGCAEPAPGLSLQTYPRGEGAAGRRVPGWWQAEDRGTGVIAPLHPGLNPLPGLTPPVPSSRPAQNPVVFPDPAAERGLGSPLATTPQRGSPTPGRAPFPARGGPSTGSGECGQRTEEACLGHFGQAAGAPTPLHRELGTSCLSSAAGDIDR